jgi:peptidyl-prolyl cis-trans isomerase D
MLMKTMRDNTKWIMLVTALAFVALMVFEWGMDITGISGGSMELGRVGATPVTNDMYQSTYRNLYDQVSRSQAEPVTSQQNREIENAAWDEVVNQILISQELNRRGIRVTDDEIRQAALFAPPPGFQQERAFQTDGQFDLSKYQQYISTGAEDIMLLQLEAYYRDIIPRGKLLRQVTSGIQVSDAALWRSFRDENERVEVAFLALDPATRVSDDQVTVSASEVQAYYRENREDFRVPATASVKLVVMGKAPTAADTVAVRELAAGLIGEIAGGTSFEDVATRESSDAGSAQDGGSLGTVFPGQVPVAMDSAIFNGPVGQVQGPIETNFGLHIVRVDNRWGADSAQARHILVPMQRTDASEMLLLARADSLERMGQNRTLEEVAGILGVPVQETRLTEDFPLAPGAGLIGEGAEWALDEASPGDVSPVFETQQAFYALELISTTPEGFQSVEEVTGLIEETLRFQKKMDRVAEEGGRWAEALRSGSITLEQIAADNGLVVNRPDAFTRADFVPGLGRQNAAVGAAFGLADGGFSGPVRTGTNVFLLQRLSSTAADRTLFEAIKEQLRAQTVQLIQQQRLDEWLASLRTATRVVDRRQEVFRAAEEAAANGPRMPMAF